MRIYNNNRNKNVYYLMLGTLLGGVIGLIICDQTKEEITKVIKNRLKSFLGCAKCASEKAMDTVKNSIENVKSSVKDAL